MTILRLLCPNPVDDWTDALKSEVAFALAGARYRRKQADIVVKEAGETISRYKEAEKRNHFREHVELQFGRDI